jgi:hypothetical protein
LEEQEHEQARCRAFGCLGHRGGHRDRKCFCDSCWLSWHVEARTAALAAEAAFAEEAAPAAGAEEEAAVPAEDAAPAEEAEQVEPAYGAEEPPFEEEAALPMQAVVNRRARRAAARAAAAVEADVPCAQVESMEVPVVRGHADGTGRPIFVGDLPPGLQEGDEEPSVSGELAPAAKELPAEAEAPAFPAEEAAPAEDAAPAAVTEEEAAATAEEAKKVQNGKGKAAKHKAAAKQLEDQGLAKSACPVGHVLEGYAAPHSHVTCDMCRRAVPRGGLACGCRLCNYDVCGRCCKAPIEAQAPVWGADARGRFNYLDQRGSLRIRA